MRQLEFPSTRSSFWRRRKTYTLIERSQQQKKKKRNHFRPPDFSLIRHLSHLPGHKIFCVKSFSLALAFFSLSLSTLLHVKLLCSDWWGGWSSTDRRKLTKRGVHPLTGVGRVVSLLEACICSPAPRCSQWLGPTPSADYPPLSGVIIQEGYRCR